MQSLFFDYRRLLGFIGVPISRVRWCAGIAEVTVLDNLSHGSVGQPFGYQRCLDPASGRYPQLPMTYAKGNKGVRYVCSIWLL